MILDTINSPADIKRLSLEDMSALARELRDIIIKTVSANGGHLASNLGAIELTIALHHVFDTSVDRIVWDVGHQSYSHKLLTGRRDRFHTIRTEDGISGFPKIEESTHDAFGTGHSSTSISAALGIAEARDRKHEHYRVIAVIGDGAMTGGLAFEGLNNTGHLKKGLIVILNDNEMSISPNVGALSAYMNRILTDELYRKFKKETKSFLEGIPRVGMPMAKIARKAEETIKGMILPGMLFEELGFEYIGPIDGHNLEQLIETLKRVQDTTAPLLVHIVTQKGRGYTFSEEDPCSFHGIGPFEVETGSLICSPGTRSYSEVFGDSLVELASSDERIIAITAAMKEGTGLDVFARRFPERFHDVGIAEPHAVTFAAGLAAQGLRPVVAIYSTFLQRAYDQIIHDVCLQRLPVVFAIDRAGIVGEDGPTHHGVFDISFLRHIPNLVVMAPKDGVELRKMLAFAVQYPGSSAIRYPRGKAVEFASSSSEICTGSAEILSDGRDITLLALGNTVSAAHDAAQKLKQQHGISATVMNARFVKPLDRERILSVAADTRRVVTIEENALLGGFGSAVLECLNEAGLSDIRIKRLGIPDRFIAQGTLDRLRAKCGIDSETILETALALCRESRLIR